MEEEDRRDDGREVLRRLGLWLVDCEHCGRQHGVHPDRCQHWVQVFVDGEMTDPNVFVDGTPSEPLMSEMLCCSEACATAAAKQWNEQHGQQQPHVIEAVYCPYPMP